MGAYCAVLALVLALLGSEGRSDHELTHWHHEEVWISLTFFFSVTVPAALSTTTHSQVLTLIYGSPLFWVPPTPRCYWKITSGMDQRPSWEASFLLLLLTLTPWEWAWPGAVSCVCARAHAHTCSLAVYQYIICQHIREQTSARTPALYNNPAKIN